MKGDDRISNLKGPIFFRKGTRNGRRDDRIYDNKGLVIDFSEPKYSRFKRLVQSVPPAWKNVVISPNDKKYLAQGTHVNRLDGRQISVKKYNASYIDMRLDAKHCSLIKFAQKMKDIEKGCRNRLNVALKLKKFDKTSLIAVIILLILKCAFRIGTKKPVSRTSNRGIFYIEKKHINVIASSVLIKFIGKSSKMNICSFEDKNIARFLQLLLKRRAPPGQYVFQNSLLPKVSPKDVHEFIRRYADSKSDYLFSPKSFRDVLIHKELFEKIKSWVGKDLPCKERKSLLQKAIRENSFFAHHSPYIQKKMYLSKRILNLIIKGDKRLRTLFKTKNALNIYIDLIAILCSRSK